MDGHGGAWAGRLELDIFLVFFGVLIQKNDFT